ncbi:MAG: oligosaccharide flippase family protein [Armatimonadetes bacterium]|nr:oligosaccharide flippase family protein [Armatimonadota bacterium]
MNLSTLLPGKSGRNIGSTLVTQGLSWAITLAVTLFLPAYLGEKNLGVLTLAGAFAGLLSVFVGFGTSTVLVREIAQAPERATALLRTAVVLRSLMGLIVLTLGTAATFILGYTGEVRLVILLALITTIAGQTAESLAAVLRGLEEFPKQNVASLVEKIVLSVLTVALIFARAPLWSFVAVYLPVTLIGAALSWRAVRQVLPVTLMKATTEGAADRDRANDVALPASRGELRSLALAGLPFLSAMLFVSIYGDGSSALLMSKLSTLESIGWFGLAKRFAGAAQMIPVAVAGAMLPILTRLYHAGNRTDYAQAVRRMVTLLLVCAAPVALTLIIFPEALLRLLRYPVGFAGSIPVLRLMGCVIVLWFLQQGVGTALIAAGKQAVFAKVTGIAALLAFPVCGVCIWAGERFLQNGAFGAIAADAVLEAFLLIHYARALLPELASPPVARHDAVLQTRHDTPLSPSKLKEAI